MALKKIWKDWKTALVIVQPETVISWQRKRYWWRLSRPKGPGRPRVLSEIRSLVRTMAAANPIWGAPRIYGELLKLGFEISERTVSRLMPRDRNPTQTWLTFLRNHVGQLVSIDFFTVATIRLRVLYVFSVLAHDRRRVIHFNVQGVQQRFGLHSKSSKHFRKTALRGLWFETATNLWRILQGEG